MSDMYSLTLSKDEWELVRNCLQNKADRLRGNHGVWSVEIRFATLSILHKMNAELLPEPPQ